MTDDDRQSNMSTSDDPPLTPAMPQRSVTDRALNRASTLPWWAIFLVIGVVVILYAMVTSVTYQRIIRFLADDPQTHTDDLFSVVQIVGEPSMVVGTYSAETENSVQTVVYALLSDVIDNPLVTRTGFIESETDAELTIRTDTGSVTIPKNQIRTMDPPDSALGDEVTVNYIDRITVTGTLVDRDDKTMTIRTVDPEDQTFSTSRIIGEPEILPCGDIPNCEEGDLVRIQRQGEVLTGSLTRSSQTGLSLHLDDGSTREVRRGDVDTYDVPTLTIAVNEQASSEAIEPGEAVQLGYIEGTDIQSALAELDSLIDIPVPLRYEEGDAQVTLIPFPDVDSAMQAVSAGEVQAVIYLASQDDQRLAVSDWVDANEAAGVILPVPPRECSRHCHVTISWKMMK